MTWAAFFSTEPRAFYLWGSFGAFFLCLLIEVLLLRARTRRATQNLLAEQEGDPVQAAGSTESKGESA